MLVGFAVEFDDQESYRDDSNQQRHERQPQIARRSAQNASVCADHNLQLILKQSYCKQMCLQLIFRARNCLLVRGVAEQHYHQQADNYRDNENQKGWARDGHSTRCTPGPAAVSSPSLWIHRRLHRA